MLNYNEKGQNSKPNKALYKDATFLRNCYVIYANRAFGSNEIQTKQMGIVVYVGEYSPKEKEHNESNGQF